jgi:hypothetical protein
MTASRHRIAAILGALIALGPLAWSRRSIYLCRRAQGAISHIDPSKNGAPA